MAASLVTTVKMISDFAVTSAKALAWLQPNSSANAPAISLSTSFTQLIWYPLSFKFRAIFAPIRPTPTSPIFLSFDIISLY